MLKIRIARPVSDLGMATAMYCAGLGLQVVGEFENHEGFSGVMLGQPGSDVHFEFTRCVAKPVQAYTTAEDLTVFYIPSAAEWKRRCADMLAAGFIEIDPVNPYWTQRGKTFIDGDGYRTVLENSDWDDQLVG